MGGEHPRGSGRVRTSDVTGRYVDDVVGWDYVENDPVPNDDAAHGTHVAGTIGAVGGNGGLVGVSPNVRIMALKTLSPNGGSTSGSIYAIDYARRNGARVINASWGSYGYSNAMREAISRYHADKGRYPETLEALATMPRGTTLVQLNVRVPMTATPNAATVPTSIFLAGSAGFALSTFASLKERPGHPGSRSALLAAVRRARRPPSRSGSTAPPPGRPRSGTRCRRGGSRCGRLRATRRCGPPHRPCPAPRRR